MECVLLVVAMTMIVNIVLSQGMHCTDDGMCMNIAMVCNTSYQQCVRKCSNDAECKETTLQKCLVDLNTKQCEEELTTTATTTATSEPGSTWPKGNEANSAE